MVLWCCGKKVVENTRTTLTLMTKPKIVQIAETDVEGQGSRLS